MNGWGELNTLVSVTLVTLSLLFLKQAEEHIAPHSELIILTLELNDKEGILNKGEEDKAICLGLI